MDGRELPRRPDPAAASVTWIEAQGVAAGLCSRRPTASAGEHGFSRSLRGADG
jgi:hypothetical protein